jgi:ATP sulfurylase
MLGPIIFSYQTVLEFGLFTKGKVVIGSFVPYSRYTGPCESVFSALCHNNMGCSRFIIDHDHTGVTSVKEMLSKLTNFILVQIP